MQEQFKSIENYIDPHESTLNGVKFWKAEVAAFKFTRLTKVIPWPAMEGTQPRNSDNSVFFKAKE